MITKLKIESIKLSKKKRSFKNKSTREQKKNSLGNKNNCKNKKHQKNKLTMSLKIKKHIGKTSSQNKKEMTLIKIKNH